MVSKPRLPAGTETTRLSGRVIVFTGLVTYSIGVHSEWDLSYNAGANLSYSDNITQSATGSGDFTSTLSAGLGLTQKARRINSSWRFNLQDVRHQKSSSSDQMHLQLQGNSRYELIKNRLVFDVNSAVSQQRISDRGDVALDNATVTNNRTDVRTLSFSPSYQQPLGTFANLSVSASRSKVSYSSEAVEDGQTQNMSARISNGRRFNKLSWDLSVSQSRDIAIGSKLLNGSLGLGYALTPKVRLTFSTGFDDDQFLTSTLGNLSEASWNLGASWIIDRRQNLQFSLGNRFNSQTYSFSYSRESRRGAITANYGETRTTTRTIQTEEIEVFDESGNPVFSLLLPTTATEVFLQKRLGLGVSRSQGKLSFSSNLSHENREFQLAGNTDTVLTLSGNVGYRISSRMQSALNASWQQQEFGADNRKDKVLSLGGSLSFDVGRDIAVGINARHARRSSSDSTLDFDANTVSLSVNAQF